MVGSEQRETVFQRLKELLKKHGRHLSVQTDSPTNFYLNSPTPDARGKPVFFGAVQSKKSYVSYHLMPVYMFPDLLDDMSPDLRKRMQGKSCFNFKEVDEELFAELDALTTKSFRRFKSEGHL